MSQLNNKSKIYERFVEAPPLLPVSLVEVPPLHPVTLFEVLPLLPVSFVKPLHLLLVSLVTALPLCPCLTLVDGFHTNSIFLL